MINIDKERFLDLKKEDIVFPIIKEYIADEITPTSIFLNLDGEYRFLLESATEGKGRGRFTFLGENPIKKIKSDDDEILIESKNGKEVLKDENLIEVLKRNVNIEYRVENSIIPFTGGAVGYIGYDCIRHIEDIPAGNDKEIDIPESLMLFYKSTIVYDHSKGTVSIIYNVESGDNDYEKILKDIEKIYEKIIKSREVSKFKDVEDSEEIIVDNNLKENFCKNIEKAKEYIVNGDIFQVVLSNRFRKKTNRESFEIYRRLRMENPSPYLYYIDCEDFQIIGSSPESLVKVKDGIVETLPIAGTRPRGKTAEEDKFFEEDLLADEKEISEHLMLVDLGRNDIGKVAKTGTIELSRFKEIERFSHVMHIVSEVKGELADDKDAFDAFKACFPAGTVSGAPKIRAMEIIEELESLKRELYSGAVGYFGYSGDMDVCIAIRTIVLKDEIAYIQAGAGIVHDSVPEKEYQETVNKAKALMEVV
ncbi:MAG: anthranilate synthase component I [Andreesenia angusta]|nr:anthranilate synthase component I [Andreesenia angusta]